jgi:hypothetical protein
MPRTVTVTLKWTICLSPASCWSLPWLNLRSWRWKRYVQRKRRFTSLSYTASHSRMQTFSELRPLVSAHTASNNCLCILKNVEPRRDHTVYVFVKKMQPSKLPHFLDYGLSDGAEDVSLMGQPKPPPPPSQRFLVFSTRIIVPRPTTLQRAPIHLQIVHLTTLG